MSTNNIAKIRVENGYTQEKVAKSLGVSRPTYINIESGKKELTLSQAEILSTIFRVSIDKLIGKEKGISVFTNVFDTDEKYKQMIVNILHYGADRDGKITKTKLAKLVYLVDFIWYYECEAPMSGEIYHKLPYGPVADAYFRIIDELEEDGVVVREARGKATMLSLVESNIVSDRISVGEKSLIKKVCKAWQNRTTEEIVNFTHEQMPWQICRLGEAIPYGLIFQEEPEKVYGPVEI